MRLSKYFVLIAGTKKSIKLPTSRDIVMIQHAHYTDYYEVHMVTPLLPSVSILSSAASKSIFSCTSCLIKRALLDFFLLVKCCFCSLALLIRAPAFIVSCSLNISLRVHKTPLVVLYIIYECPAHILSISADFLWYCSSQCQSKFLSMMKVCREPAERSATVGQSYRDGIF